jgi:hypothetical protein
LFWLTEEDGREFATCAASDFRAAMTERDELRAEVERLRAEVGAKKDYAERMDALAEARYTENQTLRAELRAEAALRQILEDPDARILDSHRDDGWEALVRQLLLRDQAHADDRGTGCPGGSRGVAHGHAGAGRGSRLSACRGTRLVSRTRPRQVHRGPAG